MAATDQLKQPDAAMNGSISSNDREAQISNSGSKRGGWITFPFLAGTVTGLTVAGMGWSANLIVYLIEEFNIMSIDAAQIVNVLNGCTNLFPVIGAIIADSFFGSFSVISVSSVISLLGTVLLALTASLNSLRPPQCEIGSSLCKSPSKLQLAVLIEDYYQEHNNGLANNIGADDQITLKQSFRFLNRAALKTDGDIRPDGSILVIILISASLFITLIDRLLIPTWQKLTGGSLTTPLQQIGFGHVLNLAGMVVSALVESKRLKIAHANHLQDQPGSMVPMLAVWLFPQLVLVGIGEAFHFPGQVALYYQEFPVSLRSTSTAMIALIIGIGFYLSTAIIDLVRRVTDWLPDNLNNGRLDNVYWTLAVIAAINFGYYVVCSMLYKYRNAVDKGEDDISGSNNISLVKKLEE
ncbi:hypothetical protein LWI28_019718 [Acer negundo]|uniref:Protein NRT1/ PTR FAMILY 2.7-like n=1 Tax=Acer negundo TaxID=4023 RepID=A0AAD5P3M7_ACENE|nr:hypothetical protein LWI28_019718 [Acer negundo]